jgi:DNA-binding transcriptional LysR family regulator
MDAIAVFVKVVEAGSFSVAARRLGMPKTTVSAKVAGLEKRLGVRLIQRTTRKLRMTEAGEKYFHHCAIAIREVSRRRRNRPVSSRSRHRWIWDILFCRALHGLMR